MPPVCFPVIQDRQEFCPREELTFSNTPPTCVRVVPVYQDITYTLGQFPPPVHFYISDTGEAYQLAPIQSPPSVPPEYHAVLDSTGCILVGVEFSNMRRGKILPEQVDVLPGVLRYVLTTLGLPLTSVTNALPPDRCNPNLWQQILTNTQNCLLVTPPPPPNPCDFVLQCVGSSTINVQDTATIDLTLTGITLSGNVIVSSAPGNQLTVTPTGLFVPASSGITVQDTTSVDLTLTGTTLSATVVLNPSPNNAIVVTPTGLFAPQAPIQSVQDTNTVDLNVSTGGVLSANVIVSPAPGNQLTVTPTGLFVSSSIVNVNDTPTVDLTLSGGVLSAQVIVAPVPNNKLVATPSGLFVDAVCGYSAPYHGPIDGQQGPLLFLNGSCLRTAGVNAFNVPYGSPNGSGTLTQGNLYFDPNLLHLFATNIPYYVNVGSPALVNLRNSAISAPLAGRAYVASVDDYNANNPIDLRSTLMAAINYSAPGFSLWQGGVFTSIDTVCSSSLFHFSTFYSSVSSNFGQSLGSTSTVHFFLAQDGPIFAENSFLVNRNTTTQLSSTAINSFSVKLSNFNYSNLTVGSFMSLITSNVGYIVMDRSFVSLRSATIDEIYAEDSVVAASNNPPVSGSTISQSVVLLRNSSIIPNLVFNSLVAGEFPQPLFTTFMSDTSVTSLSGNTAFIPGFSRSEVATLTIGRNSFVNAANKFGSVFVGFQIAESSQGVLEVGRDFIMSNVEYFAGGYQIAVYDSRPLFQSFSNEVFYFFNNGNSFAYANNAAASAALNAIYGTDPRIKYGSFVFVNVAGTPAIFAWNGTTFVRITV